MKKIIENLFGAPKESSDDWNQEEREALIDLLVFAMYADRHLSIAENVVLQNEIDKLKWESSTSIEIYLNSSTTRISSLITTDEGKEEVLNSVRERLVSYESRQRVFFVCESLISSDGKTEEEIVFLDNCRKVLNV
ncbi:hypothetical protein MLD52_18475 [Puniceicoccaceae bacterium K14]|nr:hypothetical protein [Puniceicoccaceae bacterium K14]